MTGGTYLGGGGNRKQGQKKGKLLKTDTLCSQRLQTPLHQEEGYFIEEASLNPSRSHRKPLAEAQPIVLQRNDGAEEDPQREGTESGGYIKLDCVSPVVQSRALRQETGEDWVLVGVYASTNWRERRLLWKELLTVVEAFINLVVIGDFNCITREEEKGGGRKFTETQGIKDFKLRIDEANVSDLGCKGVPFTWCNMQEDGFRWWLVEWLEATETVYYLAADYPYTLCLGEIYSCSLDSWLYNFCNRLGVEDMDVGAPSEV
ncbi:hypothetical protein Taro_052858 [Colocasia esculenta]|uniref:Endonuclease/exonuclease/phosphatase domain-containing protein n=1 Tax=Colocasia esculenta TaxID=4460 RepID=A0A843XKH8_COLES|nr:hypothetical protein [Colocasia esculenta]